MLKLSSLTIARLTFIWWVSATVCSLHAEPPIQYSKAKKLGKLAKHINESSGLAASHLRADVLWTHNDSGNSPLLYCFDLKGNHVGSCMLQGTQNIDWEDMASCKLGGKPYLLIGDVGDNGHSRSKVRIHLVPEPTTDTSKITIERTIEYNYETGAHDCESLAIDPTDNTIVLVAKGWTPKCEVFTFTLPDPDDKSEQTAKKIATLKLAGVTGMDISPDGARAVLLTYGHAYEYTRGVDETWKQAFARPGRKITMPKRKQGEAICFGQDGRTLYTTSEKAPSPLFCLQPKSTPPRNNSAEE